MPPTEAQLIVFNVSGHKSTNKFNGLLVVEVDKVISFVKMLVDSAVNLEVNIAVVTFVVVVVLEIVVGVVVGTL